MESRDSSRVALKIVFGLSLVLVLMDSYEIYFSYSHLVQYSKTFDPEIFNSCIKYHVFGQIFFTFFATFAGLSACLMALGLLVNYEFFATKGIETFIYLNYLVFGPYLLSSCFLAYCYWDKVIYNCDSKDYSKKYLNFSSLMALLICFVLSVIITFGYTIISSFQVLLQSVRFRPEGNRVIGRLFWDYIIHREVNESNPINNINVNNNNINHNNNQNQINNNNIPINNNTNSLTNNNQNNNNRIGVEDNNLEERLI